MKRSPDSGIGTRSSCHLISSKDDGLRFEDPERSVDDEDTSASLKAFHMLL